MICSPLFYRILPTRELHSKFMPRSDHTNKPQDFWDIVLGPDKTKAEMFSHYAQHHVGRKPNTEYQHQHILPTVKYVGGRVIFACFAARGPGNLAVIESTMNSSVD